jgi:hypothetical protein
VPRALGEYLDLRVLKQRFGEVANLNEASYAGNGDPLPSISTSIDKSFLDGCSYQLQEYHDCLQDNRQPGLPLTSFLHTQQPLIHIHLGGILKSTMPEYFTLYSDYGLSRLYRSWCL